MTLFAAFVLSVALDAALTLVALHMGARETTPVMRWLFGIFGPVTTFLITHVTCVLVVWAIQTKLPPFALAAVTFGWWLIVFSNIASIVRQRRARS